MIYYEISLQLFFSQNQSDLPEFSYSISLCDSKVGLTRLTHFLTTCMWKRLEPLYCHFTFNIHMNFTASQSHRACVPLTLLFQSDFSIQNHFSRKVFLVRVSFGEVFFSRICSYSLLPVLNMILQMFLTVRQDWDFFYLKCIE